MIGIHRIGIKLKLLQAVQLYFRSSDNTCSLVPDIVSSKECNDATDSKRLNFAIKMLIKLLSKHSEADDFMEV
jgi:hypothetical protein